jgi:hypothetical protein
VRDWYAYPAAMARLERQRDALDQSASQRIADLRRAGAEREVASRLQYEPPDERGSYDYGPAYVSDYGIAAHRVAHHRATGHRVKPRMRRFAPPPPYFVPRP